MTKYLRVDIDRGLAGCDVTEFYEIVGDETDEQLKVFAKEVFTNHCTYGYSVVDESDVPANER